MTNVFGSMHFGEKNINKLDIKCDWVVVLRCDLHEIKRYDHLPDDESWPKKTKRQTLTNRMKFRKHERFITSTNRN